MGATGPYANASRTWPAPTPEDDRLERKGRSRGPALFYRITATHWSLRLDPPRSAAARTTLAVARLHALVKERVAVHRFASRMVAVDVVDVVVVVGNADRQPCGLDPGAPEARRKYACPAPEARQQQARRTPPHSPRFRHPPAAPGHCRHGPTGVSERWIRARHSPSPASKDHCSCAPRTRPADRSTRSRPPRTRTARSGRRRCSC